MQKLIDLISHMFLVVRNYPKPIAEAEAAKLYIHAFKDARLAVMGIIALLCSVLSMVGGFVLCILAIVYKVSPQSLATAGIIMGALLFVIPLAGFIVGLSQRFLLKISKTDELIAKIKDDAFTARSISPAH
jgi:hypothetical protein